MVTQNLGKKVIFDPDPTFGPNDITHTDYGKSYETLQLEYLWLKAQADLAANLAQASRLQLYRR